ncbi:hypothetical protein ACIBO1_32230 [Micromonospora sp. NPDC049903]|uniref:hypothetical protein n=1 Tax=Micromonospora sp. NPDC049903 TaxID=3364276 RepID=UPI00378B9C11
MASCGVLLPSHDYYAVGVARIGDRIHIYAPLCEGEQVVEVEAIDNQAAAKVSDFDPTSMRFTYWKVADPTEAPIAEGWITLGDSSGYRTTTIEAGSNIGLPEFVGITLRLNVKGGQHTVADVIVISEAPEYPADADPQVVKYTYRDKSGGEGPRNAQEIREDSGCAANYPA